MLLNLHVHNYAIIDDINIEFFEGLNILSGETGAGKSLLLKSLDLLKGDRFNKNFIGNFDDKTYIEAIFKSNDKINDLLIENGIDIDNNIVVSRSFTQNNSITRINNRACNLKLLTQIGELLFDIHGQHSQLIVLNKSNYIDLIDKFNDKTAILKNNLKKNLKEISLLDIEIKKLDLSDDEIEREKDLLQYQINEIEKFDFDNYDEEALNNEYKKLTNQASLINGINDILSLLVYTNRNSFKDMSNILYENLLDLSKIDNELKELTSDALNIKELINDLIRSIDNYSNSLDIDDERVQIIEDIFEQFQSLKLKYGRDVEDIIKYLNDSKERLEIVKNIDKNKNNILSKIKELQKQNLTLANELTLIRKEIIKNLEMKIIHELEQMNMQYIDFKISLKPSNLIKSNGQDEIDFLISTNKGQELKSLSEVSSGGEISRFMLALKASLIEKEELKSIIFDEIDAGISGKTADIVGEKLKKISSSAQLIVISHLAQIASKADNHYLLYKYIENNKTSSNIIKLDYKQRIYEIARLISGSNITDKSIESAKELLRE